VTAADRTISISDASPKGSHIRLRGQDFHEGDTVLQAGNILAPRHILLAASSGHASLAVVRRPVVAILATGDELVEPSDRPLAGQIVASNSYGLAALITAAGGEARHIGIARDEPDDLARKFADAAGADILITTGGASVGDHDLVRPALEAAGAALEFYKIAMRPGKPMFFGRLGPMRVLGLPGNPLSAMIGARVFLVPLIAALLGRAMPSSTVRAALASPVAANGPRDHYMRATLAPKSSGALTVSPLPNQDSALVTALVAANCLAVLPANSPALAAGTEIDVLPLDF
ncbi:MAG: molybdopterin molybdotransferase MoeA, partial [Hyphomicrobium sp.]